MPADSPLSPRPKRPSRSRGGARQRHGTLRERIHQAAELRPEGPGPADRSAWSLRRGALWSLGALAVLGAIMLVLHRPVSDGLHTNCPDCPGPAQVGSGGRSSEPNQADSGKDRPSATATSSTTGRLPPIITGLSGPASTLRLRPRAVAGDLVDAMTQSTGTVSSLAGSNATAEGTGSSTINTLGDTSGRTTGGQSTGTRVIEASAGSGAGPTESSPTESSQAGTSAPASDDAVASASTSGSGSTTDGSSPYYAGVGSDPNWGLLSMLNLPLLAVAPTPTEPGEPPPPPLPPLPPDPILPPGPVSLPASGWLLGAGLLGMALLTARPANPGWLPRPSLPRPVASPMHSGRPRRERSAPK
jgi:hypothetical protein